MATDLFITDCRWCQYRIRWSGTRRNWLRTTPANIDGSMLRRRTICALSPEGDGHSPVATRGN